jgi:ATP-grasp domain, R2K clade family 2
MPLLVVYSRFSRDSRILREAAKSLGWETLRLDGWRLPDWVDVNEPNVAIFGTFGDASIIAQHFSRTLVGCGANWLPQLPFAFRRRNVELTTLAKALTRTDGLFTKSAITKHIAGKLWKPDELRQEALNHPSELLVLVAEPVKFVIEYRCFIADGSIVAVSPYRRFEHEFSDTRLNMNEPPEEVSEAKNFARSVVNSTEVQCPPAFVLDVGYIENRGWAVVEANECWASGIYHCEPTKVLEVLLRACIPDNPRTVAHDCWDFARHYAAAVPK